MPSFFEQYRPRNYPYRYHGTIALDSIAGGTPTDPNVAKRWLEGKLTDDSDAQIIEAVAEVMAERGVNAEEAVKEVQRQRTLNGFKRDEEHGLYVEGRQLKACLKESVSIAANEGRIPATGWGTEKEGAGNYRKGIKAWFPEHVFVVEQRLYFGVHDAGKPVQRFVHTRFGSGISYDEVLRDVKLSFTIETDHKFKDEYWGAIWLTAERNGLGACRSQGYGQFEVLDWGPIE